MNIIIYFEGCIGKTSIGIAVHTCAPKFNY